MKRIVWLLLLLLAACDRGPSRDEVVRRLITQRLVPDQQALSDRMQDLVNALEKLKPGSDLSAAQAAWRPAMLAWERVYTLRMGPLVDNSGLMRARFWPLRVNALAQRVHNPPTLDSRSVERLGVDQRGMFALEWQLFQDHETLRADSLEGTFARAAANAFAKNMQNYVEMAQTGLRDGAGLADRLCEHSQETVSKVVNQLVATIETLATDRVAIVLEMEAYKNMRASEVIGAPSGSSRELVLAQLRTVDKMYRPGDDYGLGGLVRGVAPKIDESLRARLDKALKLVDAIDGPLEVVVMRDRKKLEEAFRALKELETSIKVDLASALGVTVTFTTGDGD